MAEGWRKTIQGFLATAIESLEKKPMKRWSRESQRIGVAAGLSVVCTIIFLVIGLNVAGVRYDQSRIIVIDVRSTADLLKFKDVPCDSNEDNRASDLCAQWKAADAAHGSADMALWALVVGTIINIATLTFVASTFRETRNSTIAAMKAAENAAQALDADRALLAIQEPKLWVNLTMHNDGKLSADIGGNIGWHNYGKRPAINVATTTKILPTLVGEIVQPKEVGQTTEWITVAPGKDILSDDIWIEGAQEWVYSTVPIRLYGSVAYRDVISKETHIHYAIFKADFGVLPTHFLGTITVFASLLPEQISGY